MRSLLIGCLLVVFGVICLAQETITKETLDRQLKTIEATPANEPVILRLDQELEDLLRRAKKLPAADQVTFVASGLAAQQKTYAIFGMPDMKEFAKYLLGQASYPNVNLHREAFAGRDLSAEIRVAYDRCVKLYGKPLPTAPLYKVAFGYQRTTNAQMQGIDRRIGRHIVVFNRSALAADRLWDAALIHETWHCFQDSMETKKTLLERSLHEGIATHLTQVVDPTLKDHTVMLWSQQEWDVAIKHRDQIVKTFAADRASTDRNTINQYMVLGNQLPAIPDVPSRCGYFVALLAVRAWQQAHPKLGPAELLATKANDLWQALPLETKR